VHIAVLVIVAIGLLVQSSSPSAEEAILQVSPTSLSFSVQSPGQSPASQTITITNAGSGKLQWLLRLSQPWLKASSPSGTAPSTVTVSIDTSGLSAGSHSANISVVANAQGSPKTITVTLTIGGSVTPPPKPGNQPPIATFTYSPQNPKPGEVITFDCSPSQASANKKIASCDWDFHNQGAFVAELKNLRQHKFDSEGYFTVTLTVKDDAGAESTPTSKVITVSKTPVKDRDGDGVPDSEDQCPDQPGSVDNKGCPVTPTETLTSAVDTNRSSYIEDDEMLRVLDAWIKGRLLAGKFTIRESDVISLLSKWARREKLPETQTPNPNPGLTSCTISILDPLPLTGRLIGGLLWDEGTLWNSGMARSQSDLGYSLYRIDTKTGEIVPPAPLTVKAQAPLDNVIIFGGITWNGTTLVGAEHTGGIHFLNRSGARVGIWPRISTSYLNIEAVQDITWDGKAIWLLVKARPANDKQAKFSMYLLKLNDTGDVAQWFSISESGVEGMVWDGKSFWMTDAQKDQLYQINAEGKITRVCSAPKELQAPRGIAWDGASFWVLSTSKMKIYKVAIK
jgi:PKD repeat protein